MQIPRRRTDQYKISGSQTIHLTEAGLRQLKERLARIKQKLPELIAETARTAAYGDRSENVEYQEAKSALRRANFQILSIEDQLKRIEIISEGPNLSGKVELGSRVTLEIAPADLHQGKTDPITFQILGTRETNPGQGRISNQSPLGQALLGRSVGEIIELDTKNGIRQYKILAIG